MWYVLKDKVLYVYKASEDNVAVESFPVLGYTLDIAPFDVRLFQLSIFSLIVGTQLVYLSLDDKFALVL